MSDNVDDAKDLVETDNKRNKKKTSNELHFGMRSVLCLMRTIPKLGQPPTRPVLLDLAMSLYLMPYLFSFILRPLCMIYDP